MVVYIRTFHPINLIYSGLCSSWIRNMNHNLENIAQRVATSFGCKFAVLTGRGASAIAVALKAVLRPGDKVAVPSICCLSPVNVVSSIGMTPVICDCDTIDLNISIDSIEAALQAGCRAVIAVHLFGKPCRIGEIKNLCGKYGAILLDDACQAAGTVISGKPAGSFGDAGIISFGAGKIIPDVIGGGAVVTDDPGIYTDAAYIAESLPEKSSEMDDLAKLHRDIATAIQNASRTMPSLAPSYSLIRGQFLRIFAHKLSLEAAENISRGISALHGEIKARRERAAKYRELLEHSLITHIPDDPGQAVFRHTFFAGPGGDGGRTARRVVHKLRQGGIQASQHYFPTHLLMPEYCMRRDYFCTDTALRAVNLWVENCADAAYIMRSVKFIEEALEEQ